MKLQTMSVGPAATEVHYYRAGKGEPLLYLHHLMGIAGMAMALSTLVTSAVVPLLVPLFT